MKVKCTTIFTQTGLICKSNQGGQSQLVRRGQLQFQNRVTRQHEQLSTEHVNSWTVGLSEQGGLCLSCSCVHSVQCNTNSDRCGHWRTVLDGGCCCSGAPWGELRGVPRLACSSWLLSSLELGQVQLHPDASLSWISCRSRCASSPPWASSLCLSPARDEPSIWADTNKLLLLSEHIQTFSLRLEPFL